MSPFSSKELQAIWMDDQHNATVFKLLVITQPASVLPVVTITRCPREGNDNPLLESCLENPMDSGAWQATVHEVAKSRTRLSNFTFIPQIIYQIITVKKSIYQG